jgi:hypothetical protein
MKLSLRQIKLEQVRLRKTQNPSKKNTNQEKKRSKLKSQYWRRIKQEQE